MKPIHHPLHRFNDLALWQQWPVNHDDRDSQPPRSQQLGLCAAATSIFGDNSGNLVGLQQLQIAAFRKGSPRDHQGGAAQWQRHCRRINQPQQIMVLWLTFEIGQVLATNGKENPTRGAGKGRCRSRNVRNAGPVVALPRLPCGPLQRDQGGAGFSGSLCGVVAHLCRKRVGRVDQMGELFTGQIGGQPCHPAKSADSDRDRLGSGVGHATSIGQRRWQTGIMNRPGQQASFGRAAKDQDVGHG